MTNDPYEYSDENLSRIQNDIATKLIEEGYDPQSLDHNSHKCVFAAIKGGPPHDAIIAELFNEIHIKLDYLRAKHFDIEVMPDDAWIAPVFGYFVQVYWA